MVRPVDPVGSRNPLVDVNGNPLPTMGGKGSKDIVVGGVTIHVDQNAQAMHLVMPDGRIIPLPKNAHFNGQKGTVDLPGGDHLTFRNGQPIRNTPQPKTGKLDKTTYYQNPYTGPAQKVNKGTGQASAPKPVPHGTIGPVPAGHQPGSAPLPPPSPAAPPVKKAATPRTPAPSAAALRPVAPSRPAAAPAASGVASTVPSAGAPHAAVAPSLPPATGPLDARSVNQRVQEMFGAGMATYLKDKELGPILRQAATEGWSQLRLQGAIQGTSWWRNTADPARKWGVLNALDHATARTQVGQQAQSILDSARADGLNLSPLQVHDLAVNALKNGWTAGQVRQNMYNLVSGGDLATAEQTRYGYLAGLADNPEVKALLEQGAREGWDQNRLLVALQGTNFWKQTTDAQRRWQSLTAQDPGTAKSSVTQQTASVLNTAQALGVILPPDRAQVIAQDSLQFGWSAEQVSKAIGAEYHYQPGTPAGGVAGKSAADLKQLAAQYLVLLSDETLGQWTQNIVKGTSDETAFTDYLKSVAKIARPWAAKQIDAGQTVEQIVDPWKQLIASTLNIAPSQVDFSQPKYGAVLDGAQQADGHGTGVHGPMSLSQAAQYLRGLDDYKATPGAIDQAATFAQSLVKTLGKVA
jgi:hypothetical protein